MKPYDTYDENKFLTILAMILMVIGIFLMAGIFWPKEKPQEIPESQQKVQLLEVQGSQYEFKPDASIIPIDEYTYLAKADLISSDYSKEDNCYINYFVLYDISEASAFAFDIETQLADVPYMLTMYNNGTDTYLDDEIMVIWEAVE